MGVVEIRFLLVWVAAGAVIIFTGWNWLDPAVSTSSPSRSSGPRGGCCATRFSNHGAARLPQ